MRWLKSALFVLLLFNTANFLYAQTEQQIKEKLRQSGMTEEQIKQKAAEYGIDLNETKQ